MKKTVEICFTWNNFETWSNGVVFISSSSDSPEYSSVISSVKISLPKQSSNWLFVRVDLQLTLINLWLSSDIN